MLGNSTFPHFACLQTQFWNSEETVKFQLLIDQGKNVTEPIVIEMKKKLVYLGLSILEISKIIMDEFWYDHVKQKYNEKVKFCYMDTDSFTVYVKTEDSCEDIVKDTGNV